MVEETRTFQNVVEKFMLYDTIGIYYPPYPSTIQTPDGWFATFAALGAANDLNFFNVRNRSVGLMWCNQDKRDQLAWPFWIESIGVTFWSQPWTGAPTWDIDYTFSPEDYSSHIFVTDLPRHCGVTVRVQQDDRLKTHAYFCSPGYGPFGDGFGRGQPGSMVDLAHDNAHSHHLAVTNQGTPIYSNRFRFPVALEVPRNSPLNVRLTFTEYGRQLLQTLPWLNSWMGQVHGTDDIVALNHFAGIQVSLVGKRGVQQRGEYHR